MPGVTQETNITRGPEKPVRGFDDILAHRRAMQVARVVPRLDGELQVADPHSERGPAELEINLVPDVILRGLVGEQSQHGSPLEKVDA